MQRNAAYPPELRTKEDRLIAERRKALTSEETAGPRVGFALSGGGIRSATFCLGLFQGLAGLGGILRRIDYLSTVSGGGYFGSFLGRLSHRREVDTPRDLEDVLTGEKIPGVLRNLRENGRYLSPNGGGDLLLGGAVLLRNWMSLQVVLWGFVLMGFLLFQCLRVGAELAAHWNGAVPWAFVGEGSVALSLWWSPLGWLALLVFVLAALPLSWAYWLVRDLSGRMIDTLERPDRAGHPGPSDPSGRPRPSGALVRFVPTLVVALAAFAWLWHLSSGTTWSERLASETFWLASALLAIPLLALVYWAHARWLAERQEGRAPDPQGPVDDAVEEIIFEDMAVRNDLSRRVRTALVTTAALAAIALIDSLGQTLYVFAVIGPAGVASWVGGLLATLTGVAGFGRRMVVRFATRSSDARLSLPRHLIATVAAIVVVAFLLVVVDTVSHAVAWMGRVPAEVTMALATDDDGEDDAAEVEPVTEVSAERPVSDLAAGTQAAAEMPVDRFHRRDRLQDLAPPAAGFGLLCLLSFAVGRVDTFVNRSSHHPLYTSRLVRAYLGASNPARTRRDDAGVTATLPGDDMNLEAYWPPLDDEDRADLDGDPDARPKANGFPLHLINVTVNETVDGRSQVQQQDRKGTGLALGPAGLSLGVRHHVVGPFGQRERPPRVSVFPDRGGVYRAFEYPAAARREGAEEDTHPPAPGETRSYRGEPLTLGAWIGISGAAFTTGLGFRTTLGLSLLAGLANVRLGYWWSSGVDPDRRPPEPPDQRPGPVARLIGLGARLFPVQSFLIDELFARFPGTARQRWYLSDGGFFENLGGYELIRRRLPLTVVVDATGDPDYQLGALANLVRKARLDFGAEIEFLDRQAIGERMEPEAARWVGTLGELRRGRRTEESAEPEEDDRSGTSRVHAALARVRYEDEGSEGPERLLLFVKPTLVEGEPEDVLDYHRRHPDFPQETTGDQFFDEAQWESYRRLGEQVARRVFAGGLPKV